jgi:hypothetical protein
LATIEPSFGAWRKILRRPNAPTRTDGRRPSLPWRGRVPETSVPPAVTRLGAEP